MRFVPLLALASTTCVASPVRHAWSSVGDMVFAHGSSTTTVSEAAVSFLADHYQMVTFGNCYGKLNGTQESQAIASSQQIKAREPSTLTIFYFKSWMSEQMATCSSANETWLAHPEWRLLDDNGNVVGESRYPYLDVANPEATAFWINHLTTLAKTKLPNGALAFDGFFIDGIANTPDRTSAFVNISDARYARLLQDKWAMIAKLQDAIRPQGQFAITNALDTVWAVQQTAGVADAAMMDHTAIIQFVDRSTGELLPSEAEALFFDVGRSPLLANRTVQVKGWPGPIIAQPDKWPSSWPQPTTPAEFRDQAAKQFNNALSYFLLIAEDNYWWGYSWFWKMLDVEPDDPNTTVPEAFYPQLRCPLGPPLGPPRPVGQWRYQRDFANATVRVDLTSRADSNVTFHAPC